MISYRNCITRNSEENWLFSDGEKPATAALFSSWLIISNDDPFCEVTRSFPGYNQSTTQVFRATRANGV